MTERECVHGVYRKMRVGMTETVPTSKRTAQKVLVTKGGAVCSFISIAHPTGRSYRMDV